ncbi:methyltransferase domain-containing protein [Mycena haematopus]|nr:methyltransferase domain-containing protein [Mycena haematopus]
MALSPRLSGSAQELKSHIASTYNAIAPQYNAWTVSHNARLPSTTASTRILELGAGAGDPGTALLASLPAVHIIANDISTSQLSLLEERLASEISAGKVQVRQGDMMDLTFAAGEFDAVVALYSVLHLPREEQGELLRRVGTWVRGGGWMLVNFAGKEIEGSVQMGWLEERTDSQNAMYWNSWSPAENRRLVEEAGFRIEVAEIVGREGEDADFWWVLAQKV